MSEPRDSRDTGELNLHRIKALEQRMNDTLSREVFDARMDSLTQLLGEARTEIHSLDEKMDDLAKQRLPERVERLEAALGWGIKIVMAIVISAVLGLVVYSGMIDPPT